LPLANYARAGNVCSITIAVKDRRPVFSHHDIAADAVDVLKAHARKTGVLVYAYCVMPDHVHLVLEAAATCDLVTFVGQFKNLAQRAAWRGGVEGAFWQTGFYDHFLRRGEQLDTVVRYVLDNPVRAGLVHARQDYAFAGSLVLDVTVDA
jgi:REP element-mobilizing transposase RayT